MVGHIAFVPIEAMLVTLIIHRLLRERYGRARLDKLNMVFHLPDELENRDDVGWLPDIDYQHLANDTEVSGRGLIIHRPQGIDVRGYC